MNTSQHLNPFTSSPPEEAYERLTGYAFVRRYISDNTDKYVADIQLGGKRTDANVLKAPGLSCKSVDAASLQSEDDSFDVVVALQVLEHVESPEEFVGTAKRILKPDGMLIISTPDKQVRSNQRNHHPHISEMYVQEFRELLGRHFGNVSLRRQGAIAGGFVSGSSDSLEEAQLESIQLSSSTPSPGSGLPPTAFVLAVCSDGELEEAPGPYLLLDQDRRIFEEDEDHREDVELLRDEVRRMQETEVQSFQNTIALRTSEVAYLRSELGLPEGQGFGGYGASGERVQELKEQNNALKRENDKIKNRLHSIEGSNIWRLTAPYRRGRVLLDSWLKRGSGGDNNGRG